MSERIPTFEWDERKNEINLVRHGIDFWDAMYIWTDPHRQERYDALHSTLDEDRWQTIGMSRLGVLMVIYTDKVHDAEATIESSRHALRSRTRSAGTMSGPLALR